MADDKPTLSPPGDNDDLGPPPHRCIGTYGASSDHIGEHPHGPHPCGCWEYTPSSDGSCATRFADPFGPGGDATPMRRCSHSRGMHIGGM